MRNCSGKIYIFNEKILSTQQFDKTLLYKGKPLYEVISFNDRKLVFLDDHIERLNRSAELARLQPWITTEKLIQMITSLPDINEIDNGSVTIVFNFLDKNTFTTYINENIDSCTPEDYQEGVETRFYFKERENPNVKLFNCDFRERAGEMIKKYDLREVILVDKKGYITEGSKSNVFMIRDETVYTSPVEDVLPGVTRKHIIQICKRLGINLVEEKTPYILAWKMDAVFLTGTTIRVLPVKSINDMGYIVKNPLMIRIMEEFEMERERNR